jgi:hypothetical protein
MRARDRRAIAFWIVSTLVIATVTFLLTANVLALAGIVGAYNVWLLTRPRMVRVFRRLRGVPDWSGYFMN